MYSIQPADVNNISDDIYIFYLNITYACNLKCSYCYNDDKPFKFSHELTGNTMKLMLDNLYKNIGDKKVRFHVVGGEPTVNNNLVDIINTILNSNMNIETVKIFTNGLLLDKFANDLSKYDKNKLEVNITYHAEQVNSDAFASIIDHIKTFDLNFKIYILLNPAYIDKIDNLLLYLNRNKDVKYIFTTLKKSTESTELYKKYSYLDDRKVVLNSNIDGDITRIHETELKPGTFYGMKCMYIQKVFSVDPNGRITRACSSVDNVETKEYYVFFSNHVAELFNNTNQNCTCNALSTLCDCDISYEYMKWVE